jgi:hypothetical protein
MGNIDFDFEAHDRVLWREGTWRCECCLGRTAPVLRLYDGDKLELEHKVVPGTDSATADAMHQSVLRYLCAECVAAQVKGARGGTVGPRRGVMAVCRRCGSLRGYLKARRPGQAWYFCPDCHHQWDAPLGSR